MATRLPAAVESDLSVTGGATYEDRLKPARYRSPSGREVAFDYEALRRTTELRGSAYSFPGVDEHFVQRTGFGSRMYPMRCVFWGPNHDLAATAFEAACLEPGQGTLTHPMYGAIKVVPFGPLARRNDLVGEANTSVVDVTFWTSLPSAYPGTAPSRRNEITAALTNFDAAAARQFDGSVSVAGAIEQESLRTTVSSMLTTISDGLSVAAEATDSARAAFDDQVALIERGLETLVGQPLLLAQNIVELTKAPARAASNVRARLAAYARLAADITSSPQGATVVDAALRDVALTGLSLTRRHQAQNDVRAAELVAMSAVAGAILSGIETEFRSRPSAQGAAASILAQLDSLNAWRDAAIAGIGGLDDGEAYQDLHRAASLAAGHLIEASFSLLPERVVVLDRARTIVDLAAELFGAVDSRLDELIETNGLTGSEILELPRGASIVYYEAV